MSRWIWTLSGVSSGSELSMAPWIISSGASVVLGAHAEARFDCRHMQDAFDHFGEAAGLAFDHRPVTFHAIDAADDALRQVLGGGLDDGDRRTKFMRDAGDEFHLLVWRGVRRGGSSA